ncbi:MAG: S41 family peptidase [Bacteroidota bacterium]
MTKKGTLFVVSVGLLSILWLAFQQTDIYFLIKKNFSIFSKAYEEVALEYVDQVDPQELMRTGIDAMMETLDPYTVLYSEAQNEQAEILSRGNYAGVGIEVGFRDGEVVIVAPTEGGPADQKGIRAGDVILAIDGVSTEGLQPEEVQGLTTGEVGSDIVLTIQRFGVAQPLDFELTRARIEVPNVSFKSRIGANEEVGYIRLAQFGMRSADEIRTAILGLEEEKELSGLIIDLRDNPGGILQEAVAIIDKFVEPGITVVETRGRKPEYNDTYTTREPILFEKPIIVLVNGGSASASEVVAGALQDLDRAVILGEQSFGKGLVQIVKPLPYNTSLKITISRYYIPSGRSIQSIDYTSKRSGDAATETTSLKTFETRNGRTVNEARGIEPDILKALPELSLVEISLLQQGVYFDFATQFEAGNPSFEETALTDEVWEEFKDFVVRSRFNYTTDAEVLLDELEAELNPVSGVSSQIDALRESIEMQKAADLEQFRSQIAESLWLEIAGRYKGQTGRMQLMLQQDEQVLNALELIKNPGQIERILSGQ